MDIHEALSFLEKRVAYGDVRYHERSVLTVRIVNGIVESASFTKKHGYVIRAFDGGMRGVATGNDLSLDLVQRAVDAAKKGSGEKKLAERKTEKGEFPYHYKIGPEDTDVEEFVKTLMELHKETKMDGIVYSQTGGTILVEKREIVTSDGAHLKAVVPVSGILQLSIAQKNGVMRRVYDSYNDLAGFELFSREEARELPKSISKLAIDALQAKPPKAGEYTVVLDPDIVGLLLHEAFGHASEGDIVANKASVLLGKLGERVASDLVTIIDSGNPKDVVNFEGSFYYVPFDDEGSIKKHTTVVENGILKGYLTSLDTAPELGVDLSGNGRAQDHTHAPIVRQTNYFILPRDRNPEEMFEGISEGYYVLGRGAGGGQVDPAMGTFTFQAGPSYYIENGQIKYMVYGVLLSGQILDALKSVDAVGNDLRLTTSARGGCGKGGQLVKVGHGGPHVRLKLTIGGR